MEKQQVLSEVTSIANEELRTGQKIPVPNAEQLVANASKDIFITRKIIHDLFSKMSKKATLRTIAAIFSLPEDGVPVELQTDEEKQAYAYAQRHMISRFTVMQKHVMDEKKRIQEEVIKRAEELKQKAEQDKLTTENKETTNE
jgi:hypothetical protein